MTYVPIFVTEEEKSWMEDYAKKHNLDLSQIVKAAFFEKAEDEFFLSIARQYEDEKAQGLTKSYSLDEVVKKLGFENEI